MYGASVRNPWNDGRDASVSNDLCELRSCLHVGEDKGSFTPGVGYTRYYDNPQLVCMTRHLRGCPHPQPEPDPEKARCCPAPSFAKPRKGHRPMWQTCRTCGARANGKRLELAKTLPKLPHAACAHNSLEQPDWRPSGSWWCRACSFYWDHKPKPYEVGETHKEILDREFAKFEEHTDG